MIRALDEGKDIKDVNISLKLLIIKPLHAKSLIEIYNHMTSSEGRDFCLKGWKVAGNLDATEKGLDGLQNLDPFHDIDPLATSDSLEEVDGNDSKTKRDMYQQNETSLLSLMTMESRNTKVKMETFFMYSVKKVIINKFKL